MPSHRLPCFAAGLLALAMLAAPAGQGLAPPRPQGVFSAGTTLVPLDVRVVDRSGQPVTDLQQSDFTILEDGLPQRIDHFSTQAFVPDAPPPVPTRPRRAADAFEFTSNRSRTFLIVLGRGRLQPPSKGVDAMRHLVGSRLLPQDQVAVLAWNRATDFTTDHDAVLRVLERFKLAHEGLEMRIVLWERSLQSFFNPGELPTDIQRDIDAVFGGSRAARAIAGPELERARTDEAEFGRPGGDLDAALDHSPIILQDVTALYLGVAYLRHLAGEKHLVYVSEFGVSLRGMDGDQHLGRMAADARVVLDIIHAGGVPFGMSNGLSRHPPGLGMPQAMTGRNLASLTGGSFYHHKFPNASMDVDAMDAATRFQYLLGYYPSNAEWNGKYRRIEVNVNRPGLTVLHRDGYFGRRDTGSLERKNLLVFSRVAGAAAFERPIADVPVTADRAVVAMSGATGQVQVDVTIDASRLSFEDVNGRHHGSIEIAVFCAGRRDEAVGESWQTVEMAYRDEDLAAVKRAGFRHTVTMPVTALPQNAKIVVYDYGSDLVGTKVTPITRVR